MDKIYVRNLQIKDDNINVSINNVEVIELTFLFLVKVFYYLYYKVKIMIDLIRFDKSLVKIEKNYQKFIIYMVMEDYDKWKVLF